MMVDISFSPLCFYRDEEFRSKEILRIVFRLKSFFERNWQSEIRVFKYPQIRNPYTFKLDQGKFFVMSNAYMADLTTKLI